MGRKGIEKLGRPCPSRLVEMEGVGGEVQVKVPGSGGWEVETDQELGLSLIDLGFQSVCFVFHVEKGEYGRAVN